MAFNPFNWFRKHQKVIFAGLTILCMIIFIGQFGAGDPFTRLMQSFGAGRGGGQVVSTLNGRKIYESDIERITRQRRLASAYLFTNAWSGHARATDELLKEIGETKPDNPLAGLREIVQKSKDRQRPGAYRFYAQFAHLPEFRFMLLREIQTDLTSLEAIATRDKVRDDPEKLALLRRVATVLGFQAWLSVDPTKAVLYELRGFPPEDYYFGASAGLGRREMSVQRIEDTLDFILWQQQADRLGIRLTDEDVKREIVSEAAGYNLLENKKGSLVEDRTVADFVRQHRDGGVHDPQVLVNALREEFRVVMAQGVLIGQEPGARAYRGLLGATASPAMASPEEFYSFVRDHRTTLRAQFLTVPISAFLDKIPGTPTRNELLARYERYRKQEPNPASREPGFMEPRRIAVEYLSGSFEDKYYQDIAAKQIEAVRKLADLNAGRIGLVLAATPLTGPGVVAALFDPVRTAYDRLIAKDNGEEQRWFYNSRDSLSDLEKRLGFIHYSSIVEPAVLASTVARSLIAVPDGSPLVAVSALYANATAIEMKTNVKFQLTQLLAQSDPQQLFGAAALIAGALPPPVPLARVEPEILAGFQENIARSELDANFATVSAELAKLRGKPKEAKEYLTKAAKEYHLTYGSMPKALTRDELVEAVKKKTDATLTALRDLLEKPDESGKPDDKGKIEQFLGRFFAGRRGMAESGTYDPTPAIARAPRKDEIRFWRSEDIAAKERKFEQVEKEVLLAWKEEQARKLAREQAERLEEEINKAKLNPADAERFLKEQMLKLKLGPLFELDGVAQMLPNKEVLAMRQKEYKGYQVPAEKEEFMEYPLAEMAKLLVEVKRPGDATVLWDLPARRYYVAVLTDRNEPNMAEFKTLYTQSPREDTLFTVFINRQRETYRKAVLEELRKEAKAADKDGRYKLPDSIKNQGLTDE